MTDMDGQGPKETPPKKLHERFEHERAQENENMGACGKLVTPFRSTQFSKRLEFDTRKLEDICNMEADL